MTDKARKSLKPVGTRQGIMYGSCKVHKASVGTRPPFRPIFSALNTPTYKLAKFLVPILKPLTTNEFTVKDSFHFAEEIVDQQHDLFMGSSDVDSLFTNKPLEETIEICINELFKESETVEGLCKTECEEVFYLATEDSHLIFDGMAMGYTLGTILANASLVYHEKNCWNTVYWNIDHYATEGTLIFVLFSSAEHLKRFHSYLNSRHLNISFTVENEKVNIMSFLDVNTIHD